MRISIRFSNKISKKIEKRVFKYLIIDNFGQKDTRKNDESKKNRKY